MKPIYLPLLVLALAGSNLQAQTRKAVPATRPTPQKQTKPQSAPASTPDPTLTATAHVLNLFAEDGDKFFLILDGVKVNSEPMARVTATNLTNGYYRVKVIFDDERLPDVNTNLQMEGVEPGWNEVTYRIKKKVKKGKVTFSIPALSATWRKIGEAAPTPNQQALQDDPVVPNPNQQTTYDPAPTIDLQQNSTQAVVRPDVAAQPVTSQCATAMPDAAFQGALTSIENTSFEDTKLQTARVILDANCLSAQQVKQIIQKFGFENSRLDFAKSAYSKCPDKQSYLQVAEAFQFNSSKDALNKFILEQKK